MIICEIICVGTELLMGQIVNTNAQFIAERLSEAGAVVNHVTVVGDNYKRLSEAVETAKNRCDVIILTGGLGPTDDDLTKECVAEVFGKKLVLNEACLDKIKEYMRDSARQMTKNNEKQAYIPEGSIIIENDNGTAPGCIIEEGGKHAVLLPGPPREMQPMFNLSVMPYIKSLSGMVLSSRVIRLFGIGESRAAAELSDIIKNQTNPTIAPYAKEGEVTFRITASAETEEQAQKLLEGTAELVYARLGEYIYGEGDDNSLAKVCLDKLSEKKLKIAFAESCTGGTLSGMLTALPGASEVLGYSFVTYANEAKEKILGVKHETLESFGAVSFETAKEMAAGARRVSGADIALSITGIAGPGGGSEEKPVGLVYIGVCDKNGCESMRFIHSGDRERVRTKSALCALDIAIKRIKEL